LKSGPGLATRPTKDVVRRILFDILAPRVADAAFLDLYAGFGAVGLEALSRGAARAVFVERRRECCQLIAENLQRTGLHEGSEVVCADVLRALLQLQQEGESFDVIFADPPYLTAQAVDCLAWLGEQPGLLKAEGVVIVQHHVREELAAAGGPLARRRTRRVGDTQLSFYARDEEAPVPWPF
jgi:16S rRNA (guanine(966)-N(2))-methyltransferase RsmD